MSSLTDAIGLVEAGNLQAAHRIVKNDDSRFGAWVHGIVHTLEGDTVTAAYWWGRAGRRPPSTNQIPGELAELKVYLGLL